MDWFWSHRLPLAKGAQEAGYEVTVACPGATADQKLRALNFKGLDLPAADAFRAIFRLRRILSEQRPDLVHAITIKCALISGLAALGKNVKIVHTIAGLGYLFSGAGVKPKLLRLLVGPFLRVAFNNPRSTLIFQNADDRALMIRCGFALPEKSVLICGSGVDVTIFRAVPEPVGSERIVLMPTRLLPEKGVYVFAQAARILKCRGVSGQFVIAGGLDHHNPTALSEKDMSTLTADGAAEWVGRVADMVELYAAASVVAYPSWYREGVPKVLLEAAATGRPIVTTDHPGCREAVTHNDNGLLVAAKDAGALADAIQTLLEDPELRQRMGARGRQRAEQEFRVDFIVRQTLAVYANCLSG